MTIHDQQKYYSPIISDRDVFKQNPDRIAALFTTDEQFMRLRSRDSSLADTITKLRKDRGMPPLTAVPAAQPSQKKHSVPNPQFSFQQFDHSE